MASVLDLIGETPLVEVTRIDCRPCRLFLKLESANPSGSLKDRPARTMIEVPSTRTLAAVLVSTCPPRASINCLAGSAYSSSSGTRGTPIDESSTRGPNSSARTRANGRAPATSGD